MTLMVYTGVNLAPLPSFERDMYGAAAPYTCYDPDMQYEGTPIIRVGADNSGRDTREVDGPWLSVKAGDHVYMEVMVQTDPCPSSWDRQAGATFGFDLLTSQTNLDGYIHVVCLGSDGMQAGHPTGSEMNYNGGINAFGHTIDGESGLKQVSGLICRVPWGQPWTKIRSDFIIPSTFYTWVTDNDHFPNAIPCNPTQINMIVPWLTGRNIHDNAYIRFAKPIFYLNPSGTLDIIDPINPEGGEDMATITFTGTVKDKISAAALNGAAVTIVVTRPDNTLDTLVGSVNAAGVFTIVNTYLAGNFKAQATVKLANYNDGVSASVPFTIAKVNGDMVVILNVAVA
jgi:hypothetical protein